MAAAAADMEMLKFAPFSSSADPSFWHALAKQKLNEFKLSDKPVPVVGFYPLGDRPELPPRGSVGADSFDGYACLCWCR